MTAPACITGWGAVTPIGAGALTATAAARAGVCGFGEHPFMVDAVGEPMRVARVPWIDADVQGVERFAQMLLPAIAQAIFGAPDLARICLAIGLPSPRPGLVDHLADALQQRVAERFGRRIDRVTTYDAGHAAGLLALDAALKALSTGSMQACLVAGADSYLAPQTLEWIEACDQLHGSGKLNNAWGFIPGESAGALLLEPEAFAQQAGREVLAKVVSVGIGSEAHLIKTDGVCIGQGLTAAFHAALGGLAPEQRIDNVYCDLNGEAYRADEYGFTALRTKEHFRAANDFIAPADCWGDVGAAGGPLHAMLAALACRKGYAKGPLSIIWASSELGQRAAAVVQAPLGCRE